MKTDITLEEALAHYKDTAKDLDEAEHRLALILSDLTSARDERDKAWFEYVKCASEKNYDRFEFCEDYLNSLYEKRHSAHVTYSLRKFQFKRAKKLYVKLQRKAKKQEKKNARQPGEE